MEAVWLRKSFQTIVHKSFKHSMFFNWFWPTILHANMSLKSYQKYDRCLDRFSMDFGFQNAPKNWAKTRWKWITVAFFSPSITLRKSNLVFLVFCDASGSLLGSPRSPLSLILEASWPIWPPLSPSWGHFGSLWPRTSQEPAENLQRTAENQPRTAENQPRTRRTNTGQKYFSHCEG